ncbi:dephospho-CoA kinase [Occallatibacter savannae]|uniref:dephospho-CoA kinase n=1 Tax=Occallatibacter savannae TaxID=1002691 RepID=UPI000D68E223|nr:dephospho-CoA kinase [Occallatibacter savannae]
MLRVGLTGGLGSGKSTVARMLRELGADVIESDELGRTLMEPGNATYDEIVRAFGPEVVGADGRLNRPRLADLAFRANRVKELNAIVHPAVIEAQAEWMKQVFARDPAAVAVVVSALIFEVERDAREGGAATAVYSDLRKRIDRIILITAPDEDKVSRYVGRVCTCGMGMEKAEADARARLAHQIPDRDKIGRADYVIENASDLDSLRSQIEQLWLRLKQESNLNLPGESLK